MKAARTCSFTSPQFERSGLRTLAEDQAVSYELYKDERRGKTSAVDLKIL